MKKVLLMMLFCPLTAFTQVHKYRAFEAKTAIWNGTEWGQDAYQRDISILIVMNFEKRKIKTYGESIGDYDLVGKVSQKVTDDGTSVVYKAVDSTGDECSVIFEKYNSPKMTKSGVGCSGLLEVMYKEILLVFYLRPADQ